MIDTHVHLVSANTAAYPHAERPPFETARYVHEVDELLAEMAGAGIARAAAVQPFGIYATDNAYQADSAAAHPDRLVGICGVATTPDAPDTLRYWVRERGMAGGRVITLGQGVALDDPGFVGVCRAAAELDVPLCVLTSRKHVPDLPALAARVSGVRIVLDHLGVTGGADGLEAAVVIERLREVVRVENLYLKVSTPLLAAGEQGRRVLEYVLTTAGPERVLWGTNFPVTDLGGYTATVAASRAALEWLSPGERERVVAGTARELFPGLGPPAAE